MALRRISLSNAFKVFSKSPGSLAWSAFSSSNHACTKYSKDGNEHMPTPVSGNVRIAKLLANNVPSRIFVAKAVYYSSRRRGQAPAARPGGAIRAIVSSSVTSAHLPVVRIGLHCIANVLETLNPFQRLELRPNRFRKPFAEGTHVARVDRHLQHHRTCGADGNSVGDMFSLRQLPRLYIHMTQVVFG